MAANFNKDFEKKIRAYALENAISHGGKARADAVLPKLFQEGLKKENIKNAMPIIQKAIAEINKLSPPEQEEEFSKMNKLVKKHVHEMPTGLPPLKDAKIGHAVLRFAPFPSGPLHIGNARQVILNDEYAKKYDSKLILVFDDTIGSEEKPIIKDAYQLIAEGIKWLNIKISDTYYKSDRLHIYYEYAMQLIKKNAAYVCRCSAEHLRENRAKGKECKCRSNSADENIKLWQYMLEKGKEGEATLRIKTSMQHPNPAFRDRVMFRISERKHPRVGTKFRVWPLLDFSMAIDDHLLKITHIIRGKELMIEGEVEKLIWETFKWPQPETIYTGLLQLEGIKMSKSKSAKEVLSGEYKGWDDPRTWSLQSLAKRGIRPEALRTFILQFGVHEKDVIAPIDMLYDENKKIIEKSNRYFFIPNPVKIKIKNAKELEAEIPLHPDHPERGERKFKTSGEFYIQKNDADIIKKEKGNFRLMHLLNFSNDMKFISEEKDDKLETRPMHWLPADEKQIIKIKVLMPDGTNIDGLAEKAVEKLKPGEVIQFERFGFCCKQEKEFWFTHK